MLNILVKINHSASENDNVIGGLFIPIVILSLWIYAGHPFKKKVEKDASLYKTLGKMERKVAFIMLIFITIFGIFRAINFFFKK